MGGLPVPFSGFQHMGGGAMLGDKSSGWNVDITETLTATEKDTDVYHWWPLPIMAIKNNTLSAMRITLDDEDGVVSMLDIGECRVPFAGYGLDLRTDDDLELRAEILGPV